MTDTTYNGWKNRQTWNVALWISNDERFYHAAVEYVKKWGKKRRALYWGFVNSMGLQEEKTPDGIKWAGSRLDYKALSNMMRELVD